MRGGQAAASAQHAAPAARALAPPSSVRAQQRQHQHQQRQQHQSQHVARAPSWSPPSSPRPWDPQVVHQLRAFLVRAAKRPPGVTHDMERLLCSKLALQPQELDAIFSSSSAGSASSAGSSTLQDQRQQLQELEAGLDQLLALFTSAELLQLLQQQPGLLFAPLASWCEFFAAYGFSPGQTKNLISQTRGEVLTKGTLVTAGAAIVHLKSLGFDDDQVRHRVVAYCPQVLAMGTDDIDVLIRLWEKFKVGVDERAGM